MRKVLCDCLARQGYRVLEAPDGERGLERAIRERPDLILLDIMMPRLDGFALCAELRRLTHTQPVLFLTAKGRVEDRVHGLDLGGDDFLVKPFSRDELLARVRALLRRASNGKRRVSALTLGEVEIDFEQRRAVKRGREMHFTAKEFAMLRLLAANRGGVVTRDTFLDAVWGYTAFPTTRTIDRHITSLRSKIEVNPDQPRWIKTVHGVGYRLDTGDAE